LVQRTPKAESLIDANTSFLELDEVALGRQLRTHILEGNVSIVSEVMDALDSTDRDDVAYELVRLMSDEELGFVADAPAGRRCIDRLYDELTAGSVAEEEATAAERILMVKANRITLEDFEAGETNAKVFPFRLPGMTVLSDAPIDAERRAGGRIWVKQPVRVLGTEEFRPETQTLPPEVFISGIELPENEVVGVRLYDQGGVLIYRPALFLVQLANETTTTVMTKVGEVAAIGLTLGGGSLIAGAGEAGLAARVFLVADRVAFVVSTVTSILREHRGWIIQELGDKGHTFVSAIDRLNSILAVYGFIRTGMGAVQTVNAVRKALAEVRAYRAAVRLAASKETVLTNLGRDTDDLLAQLESVRRGPAANDNAMPPLPENVIPLRATSSPLTAGTRQPSSAFHGSAAVDLSILPEVSGPVATPSPVSTPTPTPTPIPVGVEVTAPSAAPAPLSGSAPAMLPSMASGLPGLLPSTATSVPAHEQQSQPASPGPFPIYWPSLLPLRGLDHSIIIHVGAQTIRQSNPRGTSIATSEQIRVRQNIIRADPVNYPAGKYEAHHVMPMFLNGLDVFPNVVPWEKANHQTEHWRLQHQPQLSGRVWRQPNGTPIVLGPYLYSFFGVPGHPLGTPYYVSGFKLP
jgi:hypothetical protein